MHGSCTTLEWAAAPNRLHAVVLGTPGGWKRFCFHAPLFDLVFTSLSNYSASCQVVRRRTRPYSQRVCGTPVVTEQDRDRDRDKACTENTVDCWVIIGLIEPRPDVLFPPFRLI